MISGIVNKVTKVKSGDKIPLRAYEDISSFKLYFIDVGLFRTLAGISSSVVIKKDAIFDEFNGLIAEQYVLQQLINYDLHYWSNDSKAEVDFVFQFDDNIIPIEVKSGTNVKAKSLKVYRDRYNPKFSIRFSLKKYEHNLDLINIPLFKSFLFYNITRSDK